MKACLNTHAVLWCPTDARRLGTAVRTLVSSSSGTDLIISDIVLLGVSYLFAKGRIGNERCIGTLLEKISDSFRVVPIDPQIAQLALELDLPHGDPFDRVISATAKVHEIPLITRDRLILESGVVATIW